MVVNYWHRKSGFYDGEPGVYHRLPRTPDFTRTVWLAIPTLQYDDNLRAYWVPLSDSHEFERLVLDQKIASPCGRCQRGEPCTAWDKDAADPPPREHRVRGAHFDWIITDEPDPSQPGFDFDTFVSEFYKQVNRDFAAGLKIDPVIPRPSGFQTTYGRSVDRGPSAEELERQRQERLRRLREERERHEREARERRDREARERAAREPPIQQPPDVRVKAARLLGVGLHADEREIKKAVHRLALQHHPDRGGDSNKMAEVLDARDVMLGKARTRRRM